MFSDDILIDKLASELVDGILIESSRQHILSGQSSPLSSLSQKSIEKDSDDEESITKQMVQDKLAEHTRDQRKFKSPNSISTSSNSTSNDQRKTLRGILCNLI